MESDSNDWVWDASEDVDSAWKLARRAKHKYVVPDQGSLELRINPAAFGVDPVAFEYDHEGVPPEQVGCSVSCLEINDLAGRKTRVLVDWTTHALAIFDVAEARQNAECGVISRPVSTDPSHCLVRVSKTTRVARRELWLPLRSRLAAASIVLKTEQDANYYDARRQAA